MLTLALVLALSSAHAYETDQLTGRDHEIPDVSEPLNAYLREMIETARASAEKKLARHPGISDEQAADVFRDEIEGLNPFNLRYLGSRAEGFMYRELQKDYGYLPSPHLYSDFRHIYHVPGWNPTITIPFVFGFAGLVVGDIVAPTYRMGDVRFGSDKISHFLRVGYRYYKKSRHGTRDDLAIRYGTQSENGSIGLKAIGVFSFADLTANLQGYHFYRALVGEAGDDRAHYVIARDGRRGAVRFVKAREFDFRDYALEDWDEYLNPSYYRPELQAVVTYGLERRRAEVCAERARWLPVSGSPRHALLPIEWYVDLSNAPKRIDPYRLEELCQ